MSSAAHRAGSSVGERQSFVRPTCRPCVGILSGRSCGEGREGGGGRGDHVQRRRRRLDHHLQRRGAGRCVRSVCGDEASRASSEGKDRQDRKKAQASRSSNKASHAPARACRSLLPQLLLSSAAKNSTANTSSAGVARFHPRLRCAHPARQNVARGKQSFPQHQHSRSFHSRHSRHLHRCPQRSSQGNSRKYHERCCQQNSPCQKHRRFR
mmetsp:Transcript_8529/g.11748  ORF Transcript_8529/g.11748 Transcript_8529/m.11748 type:complete len:210 (+) Transcript_8529:119-748(+)